MNFREIFWIIGIAIILEGLFMLTALPFSLYYASGDHFPILIAAGITLLAGFVMWVSTRWKDNIKLNRKESYVAVTLSWVFITLFGTLPYLLAGSLHSFTDAAFETMSGFTTTGASVYTDVEVVPKGLLFWRAMTVWMGGMGIIGLSVALVSFLGAGGSHLYSAETSDPLKSKIHPRIREALKRLWGIYILLSLVMTGLLLAGGVNLFESLCHVFTTMGTGGFSTRNASIGAFSPYIQYVIIVFMILGATNFAMIFFTMTGRIREVTKDQELKLYFAIILFCGLFSGLYLYFSSDLGYDLEKSLRFGFFHVASIISTTGYAVDNYDLWPVPIIALYFILLFPGGSTGSTTGGIKVVRLLVAWKAMVQEFRKVISPNAIIPLRINGMNLPDAAVRNIMVFIMIYILSFIIGTFALTIAGTGFFTSASAVATCLGNVGPGFNEVGPAGNFSSLPDFSKWVLTLAMMIGRLELFSVLLLLVPAFWKR